MLSGKLDVIVMIDCKSQHDAIQTSKNVDDKGLRIPIACLRQRVNNSEMTVRWISTKKQLAECLTKAGAPTSLPGRYCRQENLTMNCLELYSNNKHCIQSF